jgi:hypothetical protein
MISDKIKNFKGYNKMGFDKLNEMLNFLKKIEKNYKFLFAMFFSAIFTIIFTITPTLWFRVFSDFPQYQIIILVFCIIFAILYPIMCMISHFHCWRKGKIRAENLKEEAKKETMADLLGLCGLRHGHGEFMEHKYPYPDNTIQGLAWTLRIKRHSAAVGQPFCINCKVPMYDYTPNTYNKRPITVTITCTKCKKNYLIDDLEQTVKNHNFDLLQEPNYLHRLINTDVVED